MIWHATLPALAGPAPLYMHRPGQTMRSHALELRSICASCAECGPPSAQFFAQVVELLDPEHVPQLKLQDEPVEWYPVGQP